MKRITLIGFLLIAAGVLVWRTWGVDRTDKGTIYSGYIEADYVMVTSALGGTLTRLDVARGDRVTAGASLFILDQVNERAARDEAAARFGQAQAQLSDLLTGRRPQEIDQLEAQRKQAQAALRQSEAEFVRQTQLRAAGTNSAKQLDDARAQRDRNSAALAEANAQIEVGRLPGRDDQIRAARSNAEAAQAALAQANWRLGQKSGQAPADALVVDTLYRPGEMVQAGLPVVQLLPPANLKIRFFVPQDRVAQIGVGQSVSVTCDGCAAPIPATVRYISPQAEFTPPVIYSREQRARLVFMVEARPDRDAERLRVGQPVDVTQAPQ